MRRKWTSEKHIWNFMHTVFNTMNISFRFNSEEKKTKYASNFFVTFQLFCALRIMDLASSLVNHSQQIRIYDHFNDLLLSYAVYSERNSHFVDLKHGFCVMIMWNALNVKHERFSLCHELQSKVGISL